MRWSHVRFIWENMCGVKGGGGGYLGVVASTHKDRHFLVGGGAPPILGLAAPRRLHLQASILYHLQ